MAKKSTYELLSVAGAFILFSCWVFQQSVLETLNSKLAAVSAAEDVFRTYQSHNALFNAIIETLPDKSSASTDKIRDFQIFNYGLGLERLADQTEVPRKRGYGVSMQEMQSYLELVQTKASELKADLLGKKRGLNLSFTLVYGLGSFLVLLSSFLKSRLPEK